MFSIFFGKIWKSIDVNALSSVIWIGIDSEYNINLHGNRLLVLVFLDLLYIFIELEVDLQVFSKLAWLISQCTMGAFIAPLISSKLQLYFSLKMFSNNISPMLHICTPENVRKYLVFIEMGH